MVSKKQIAEIEAIIQTMSLSELLALRTGLGDRITELQDQEKDKFVASIKAQAEQLGLNLGDLAPQLGISFAARRTKSASGSGTTPTGKTPAKPKYRDPANPNVTWTGKGLTPNWMKARIEEGKGKTKDDFLIKD